MWKRKMNESNRMNYSKRKKIENRKTLIVPYNGYYSQRNTLNKSKSYTLIMEQNNIVHKRIQVRRN